MAVNISRLRIAMLSAHSSPLGKLGAKDTGGMSVYVRELSRQLGRRGHRVDIYTRHSPDARDRVMELDPGVGLIHLRLGDNHHLAKAEMVSHLKGFFRELEQFRSTYRLEYDFIHSHYWLSGMLGPPQFFAKLVIFLLQLGQFAGEGIFLNWFSASSFGRHGIEQPLIAKPPPTGQTR